MLHGAGGAENHEEGGAQRGRGVEMPQVQKREVVEADLGGEVGEDRGEEGRRVRWEGRDFL